MLIVPLFLESPPFISANPTDLFADTVISPSLIPIPCKVLSDPCVIMSISVAVVALVLNSE